MYKTNDFAKMIGITSKTLRTKHKNGDLVPTYVDEKNNYRFYSDELAYKYNKDKCVLIYLSKMKTDRVNSFIKNLNNLDIKLKVFINKKEDNSIMYNNDAIKELLKEVTNNTTFTIVYDKYEVKWDEIELIKFYLNACFPFIKIKDINEFSLESSVNRRSK